jgi:hypothetical protein
MNDVRGINIEELESIKDVLFVDMINKKFENCEYNLYKLNKFPNGIAIEIPELHYGVLYTNTYGIFHTNSLNIYTLLDFKNMSDFKLILDLIDDIKGFIYIKNVPIFEINFIKGFLYIIKDKNYTYITNQKNYLIFKNRNETLLNHGVIISL